LILASGYLFDALIIVPHTLSFPGAFTSSGLLGAGEQTTAWLYVFWHGGFPLFVIAYAVVRRSEVSQVAPKWSTSTTWLIIAQSFLAVACLTALLTLLATWGHDLLPVVMQGNDYSLLVTKGVSPAIWALTAIAIIALCQREMRVMDLWLMLVMWIWLFDIALAAVLGSSRYDLGFYAGRVFGLLAAGFLLMVLLVEMARMHAAALRALADTREELTKQVRLRRHPEPSTAHPEKIESFIRHENITRYRQLLASGTLSEAERRTIKRLLSDEQETKDGKA
jgi:Membrane-associated sensor, integral membrane domain